MGATSLMAIPPLHVALPDASLVDYYATIMQATAIPLVVQDASGYVGRPISPAVLVRLCDMFGNRVYAKPEAVPIGPNISAIREATQGRVRVFEGAGGAALTDTFRRGIDGTMPAADVCWAVRAIWDALEAGDDETAYRVSGPLCALISLQTELDAFVAIEKHLLCRQHVISSRRQRGPLGYIPDDHTLAEADRLFDRLAAAVSETSRK
jgi:4-hydroxy-tetrahydrodipicolinate synthase